MRELDHRIVDPIIVHHAARAPWLAFGATRLTPTTDGWEATTHFNARGSLTGGEFVVVKGKIVIGTASAADAVATARAWLTGELPAGVQISWATPDPEPDGYDTIVDAFLFERQHESEA